MRKFDRARWKMGACLCRPTMGVKALAEAGTEWVPDIDDTLLQMEVINSLLFSEDKSTRSPEDVKDSDAYLHSIALETASHIHREA